MPASPAPRATRRTSTSTASCPPGSSVRLSRMRACSRSTRRPSLRAASRCSRTTSAGSRATACRSRTRPCSRSTGCGTSGTSSQPSPPGHRATRRRRPRSSRWTTRRPAVLDVVEAVAQRRSARARRDRSSSGGAAYFGMRPQPEANVCHRFQLRRRRRRGLGPCGRGRRGDVPDGRAQHAPWSHMRASPLGRGPARGLHGHTDALQPARGAGAHLPGSRPTACGSWSRRWAARSGEDVPARKRSPRRSRGRRAARSSSCSRAPRSGRRSTAMPPS
jgi:hypothetical protein